MREKQKQMSSVKTNFLLPLCLAEQNYVCLFGWLESAAVRNNSECGCSSTQNPLKLLRSWSASAHKLLWPWQSPVSELSHIEQ